LLTQPAQRRLVEPGQLQHVLDREPLLEEPFDRRCGRNLRPGNRLLGRGALLPGDLDVDRRLVDALLPGQRLRVEPQPALPGRLSRVSRARSRPRVCLCRCAHRDHLFLDRYPRGVHRGPSQARSNVDRQQSDTPAPPSYDRR
jgi:hypothetical protein